MAHVLLDKELKIVDGNESYFQLVGYTRERVTGMPFSDYRTTGMLNYIKETGGTLKESFDKKITISGQTKMGSPTGVYDLIRTYVPILDEHGDIKYIYIANFDITETVRLGEEAVDRAVYYESILDAIQNPVTVTDLEGKMTFVNKAVEDQLKTPRKELIGKPCNKRGGSTCTTDQCGITRLKQGFTTTSVEQDGGFFTFDCSYIQNAKGENVGHVEVISDVTALTETQNYIETEIAELSTRYELMAAGDLTIRYDLTEPDDQTRIIHDHLEKLHSAVRSTITSLQKNIGDVNKEMIDLTTTADNANNSILDASKGLQQVAKNAGNVCSDAEKASDGVEQISKAMQDMSAAVEEITSSMESVSVLSQETNVLSRKGAELAGKTEKSMVEITSSSAKVFDIVTDVEKQMGEISKIVVLIRDLANQTNLLALNAAIEAARAGDAGRGFAVVATEVKSLAQESRNSAERIEEMIGNLKKNTQHASTAMGEAKGTVEQGSQMVTETLQSFNQIALEVGKIAKSVSEVAAATEEQAATTEEVTASITEVARLVDQTAREAGDAAAATEESTASLDEITRMVGEVNKVAVNAMEANKRFKVD
ncbi:methyl-accepting chemotaxis sensory transducer with Pas/Pac sensor [Methanosphaerula palustris E1-9c]|uniref:Methyl-accepting chemotaxis sensory transducer with Pas/Pac sensor n=2 Tax=Methanosphaerula palustris TaxID=475088 RepID=B8GGR3_METPE|nr:methyl-accepting chemotaxis sensory transducer with Pas/Pac sensor [Methanosphaerula palustris E1-9c]